MAVIRVGFHIPDGDSCTKIEGRDFQHCQFRSANYKENGRWIVMCTMFKVRVMDMDYEDYTGNEQPKKCSQCLASTEKR